MFRKICFGIMALLTLLRLGAGAYVLYMGNNSFSRFPIEIFVSAGLVTVLGLALLVKNLFKTVLYREMQAFFILNGIATLFNLIFFKATVRLELTVMDFLFLGTALDVLFMVVLPVMCQKARQYIEVSLDDGRVKK